MTGTLKESRRLMTERIARDFRAREGASAWLMIRRGTSAAGSLVRLEPFERI